ncbi:MAG: glycosyltransferase family 2 protein [Anaerolineales bacterium]
MINVSVIVPCFNEEATIYQLLEAIYKQSYPLNEIEVVIADGLSTDHTREKIKEFQSDHPELIVRIVDNKQRVIPSGLNRAIEAALGKYILRLDAHSIPDHEYIQKCVRGLEEGLGDNIGGTWKIQPGASTWVAKAIAIAASHPLAAGDARYRIGGAAQEVDTVPFGIYRREQINKIGMFDETLLSNEDYELNMRLKQSGGKIWMDPSIYSVYFSRPTLRDLSRQYWRYGYWKAQMLRKHPTTLKWRQVLPPLFVLALLGFGILSIGWNLARWMLAILVILYVIVLFSIGIQMSIKHKNISFIIGIPAAIALIHLSWGFAFLWGHIFRPRVNESQR